VKKSSRIQNSIEVERISNLNHKRRPISTIRSICVILNEYHHKIWRTNSSIIL